MLMIKSNTKKSYALLIVVLKLIQKLWKKKLKFRGQQTVKRMTEFINDTRYSWVNGEKL